MTDFNRLANRVAAVANKMKSQWLDECMVRLVPPDINVAAHSDKGRHRMRVQRYLQQQKIRLAEYPDKTAIMVDGVSVAEFQLTLKDGKWEQTIRTLPPDKKDN